MDWPFYLAAPAGFFVGSSFTWFNLLVLGFVASLTSAGNIDLDQSIGSEGRVTVAVPPNDGGHGKVTLAFSGRQIELFARTRNAHVLARGQAIRVIAVNGDKVLIEPLN